MEDANSRQVGGTHYASKLQHWDFVDKIGLGYLPSVVTKYVTRWRRKDGVKDVGKSVHCLEKLVQQMTARELEYTKLLSAFLTANSITDRDEVAVFNAILSWHAGQTEALMVALEAARRLYTKAQGYETARDMESASEVHDAIVQGQLSLPI